MSNENLNLSNHKPYQLNSSFLQVYYDRLFPFSEMFRWLSYGNDPESKNKLVDTKYFSRREFTFITEDEIFIRYQSFKTKALWRNSVRKNKPIRIEIGPLYNISPSLKNDAIDKFTAVEKELVFDIDLSDYNDVRTCCKDKSICLLCWPFMNCAIKVLDVCLREDFGFKHLLWVFSGRRGVHCWVCDKRARVLSDEERFSIGQYLSIFQGKEHGQIKLNINSQKPHFSINRVFQYCKPYFYKLLDSQDWLATESGIDRILGILPQECDDIINKLKYSWSEKNSYQPSSWKFKQLEDIISKTLKISKYKKNSYYKLKNSFRDIVLSHLYPRLDIAVTQKLNHLLKSPFVIHPGTGNVCVPILVRSLSKNESQDEEFWLVDNFDPTKQPKLDDLNEQLNAVSDIETKNEIEKTELKKYVDYFVNSFVCPLEKEIINERRHLDEISVVSGDI